MWTRYGADTVRTRYGMDTKANSIPYCIPNNAFVEIRDGKESYELVLYTQYGVIKNELDVIYTDKKLNTEDTCSLGVAKVSLLKSSV